MTYASALSLLGAVSFAEAEPERVHLRIGARAGCPTERQFRDEVLARTAEIEFEDERPTRELEISAGADGSGAWGEFRFHGVDDEGTSRRIEDKTTTTARAAHPPPIVAPPIVAPPVATPAPETAAPEPENAPSAPTPSPRPAITAPRGSPPVRTPPVTAPTSPTSSPAATLNDEIASLYAIKRSLDAHDPQNALRELDAHEQKFSRGTDDGLGSHRGHVVDGALGALLSQ